ncbi:Bug family tripartite tricarboxylate transporter substrate binding protein [Roseomonas sp. GCM10028921]
MTPRSGIPSGRRSLLWLSAAFAAGATGARAQTWPDRPVRLVVGFPPGGPTDLVARLVAPELEAAWGKPVVIENRGGANATLGTDVVAKAAPDGYTLLCAANNHVMNPAIYANLPYHALDSFAPLGMIAASPNVLWAGASTPVNTLADAIAAAKARPGELGYATTGNGGNGHFGGETLQRAAGISLMHIPYRGTAPALQDVLAGRVPLFMQTLVGAIGPYRGGQIKPLVVFGPNRAPDLPDVPTLAELGYEAPDSSVWYGLLAPVGTSPALVRRIGADLEAISRKPAFQEKLRTQASVTAFLGPEDFAARIRAELPRWAQVAQAAGMKPE